MTKMVDRPHVLGAVQVLRDGMLNVRIRRGEICVDAGEWRPMRCEDVAMLRARFLRVNLGVLSERAMAAAVRLAEGYAPDEIWEVKRRKNKS